MKKKNWLRIYFKTEAKKIIEICKKSCISQLENFEEVLSQYVEVSAPTELASIIATNNFNTYLQDLNSSYLKKSKVSRIS